ncbi:unnamed protein product [Chilo suppressalis]|uniref:superoxide dismutase n=1 Tax=Chilo suppressalis TaxID=168631 RepID=A0ABN8L5P2_CHISP|nr:unnamed protein product [Chilo suppressalis]
MASSKLEVLVDFGDSPDKQQVDKTIKELTSREGVKEAQFKDGAIMVETSLPSTEILEFVTKTSGRRAVLQGFGDGQSAVAMVSGQSCCGGTVVGVVRFQQTGDVLVADGSIDGLPPSSEHGLHIHSTGDLSEGCNSIGDHYNPLGSPHGGPQDSADRRHAGDLGNIRVGDNGRATFRITDRILKYRLWCNSTVSWYIPKPQKDMRLRRHCCMGRKRSPISRQGKERGEKMLPKSLLS